MDNVAAKPKVSVISPTYNQEKYIRETLDGFVNQKTDFSFEIIVADDCSTDNTPQIIEEYAKAHPDIIRPIIRKKNIGVGANFKETLKAARGEYIALCEGDDYWTDVEKLQKQADFLDANSTYALCFHPVRVFFEGGQHGDYIYPEEKDKSKFTTQRLLEWNFIQTNSVMYRKQEYDRLPTDILPVDWYLHLYHAQFGKIGFIDQVMSAYRRHPHGLWWDSHNDKQKFWERHSLAHLAMYGEVLKLYEGKPRYSDIVYKHIFEAFDALINLPDFKNEVLREAIRHYPELIEKFTTHLYQTLKTTEKTAEADARKYEQEKTALSHELKEKEQILSHREQELAHIKSTKVWKLRERAAKVKRAGKR